MQFLEIAKYSFMAIFALFFALDIFSKKSYKFYSYMFLGLSMIFFVIGVDWSTGVKTAFIALVVILMIKEIINKIKGIGDTDSNKEVN